MSNEAGRSRVRFQALKPAPRRRVIAAFIVGPVMWVVALVLLALTVEQTDAIALGLLAALASFVVALVLLAVVRAARVRNEKRYVDSR
jgi:hypothetical protein